MAILQQDEIVGGYKIQSLIKSNLYTETYRVEDYDGALFFLKLFVLKRMPRQLLNTQTGIVREVEYCQRMTHRNIVSYIDSGSISTEESDCQYYITNYFNGTLLAERIQREGKLNEEDSIRIFRGILEGLKYLHGMSPVLCHNDLDPSNIMLYGIKEQQPEIIDLGHLSERCGGRVWFDTTDINPLYHADETRVGIFDEQTDLFSATAVLYYMLEGQAPWQIDLPTEGDYKSRFVNLKQYRKSNPLRLDELPYSNRVKRILYYGLQVKSQDRVSSVDELLQMIDDAAPCADTQQPSGGKSSSDSIQRGMHQSPNYVEFQIKKGTGRGFEDIAGMAELKETLNKQVIFVIKNEELAKQYRINSPNGMLLYGPPGCGKSFFAEKFAEETGFNYLFVKSSDLASSYVHGSQEKINQLFEQASHNTPIVICFDEFDALVPDRSWNNVSAEEVNEFLTQMNNCSSRGIFIVATSNRPDKIDPAVLRTGRIDKTVYVPLPDHEARKELFSLYLKNRPVEDNIPVDELAQLTEGYIASDIAYIVNDAAIRAAYTRTMITEDLLRTSLHDTHPSLRSESIAQYEEIRRKMEDTNRRNISDNRIGFKIGQKNNY